jgi:hypothetical protein
MIKNFITDSDLEAFYPDLESYRAGAQVDFSEQIALGFRLLLNDLQARGRNPRLLGVPLDLNRDSSSTHTQHLESATSSATENGYAWEADEFKGRRFCVNLTTKSTLGDSWSFILQGSNLTSRPEDADASWTTVETLTWAAAVAASEQSVVFDEMYRWYRLRVVKNSGSGTVTYTASVHDTIFDNLICWKAIELIALGWHTGLTSLWQTRVDEAKANYAAAIESIITSYDDDEDGVPEMPEEESRTNIRFRR